MPEEEDNPFLIKPKPQVEATQDQPPIVETFDFLASPEEAEKIKHRDDVVNTMKPHYEKSGTPIWDKKEVGDIHNPDYEVVDHKVKNEEEE
ncbi:MAG: hypothetical protein ACMUHY_04885 [Thermoplasmatota archaeon]